MLMPYIFPVLLFITHQHIFLFFLFMFCMDNANFTYHPRLIIYYSSTHFLILFFLINTLSPHFGWLMLRSFSSYFLSRLTFVQFGIHSVVSSYAWFICFYFVLPLQGLHIFIMFPHCKYFFLSSCTRNLAHNAVNTRSQSLLHRKCTCIRPVRHIISFWGHNIED